MLNTRNNVINFHNFNFKNSSACTECLQKTRCPVPKLLVERNGAFSQFGIRQSTYQVGDRIEHRSGSLDSIYMVRSGFFKTFYIDNKGEMQIAGFHFPGEIFGVHGLSGNEHIKLSDALDSSSICKIPLSFFLKEEQENHKGSSDSCSKISASDKKLLSSILQIIGDVFSNDMNFLFSLLKMQAHGRMAAFILDISERMEKSGYCSHAFKLCMNRRDIANHLNLTGETVSRTLAQFQALRILSVTGRNIHILNADMLRKFAESNEKCKSLLKNVS